MIKVNILRDTQGFIREFTIRGHAGYAAEGSDIVCAAVSAVAYTAIGALDDLVGIKDYTEESGYMKCRIPAELSKEDKYKAGIILDTMVIGLKQIEKSYRKYVRVVEEVL